MANKEMEGTKAPAFKLRDQDGKTHQLKDYQGKNVVLYWYPRDDTPGCTSEACSFRDNHGRIQKTGTVILGVSDDDAASHTRFIEKYDLPFTLLCDEDHKTAEAYDVWKEKNMYGKKSWGIKRSTFLIDGDGVIRKVWGQVKVEGHTEEVMDAIAGL